MSKQIVECVPNFSEGRDMKIIKQITDQIETVEGVKLLDVDPGATQTELLSLLSARLMKLLRQHS